MGGFSDPAAMALGASWGLPHDSCGPAPGVRVSLEEAVSGDSQGFPLQPPPSLITCLSAHTPFKIYF